MLDILLDLVVFLSLITLVLIIVLAQMAVKASTTAFLKAGICVFKLYCALGVTLVAIYLMIHYLFEPLMDSNIFLQPFIFGGNDKITFSQLHVVIIVSIFLLFNFKVIRNVSRSKSRYRWTYISFGIFSVIINALIMILMTVLLSEHALYNNIIGFAVCAYFGSINLSIIFSYGWDKLVSEAPKRFFKLRRIPEDILHQHASCGGTIGAAIAQIAFRHKITSDKFQPTYRKTVAYHTIFLVILIMVRIILHPAN